MNSPTPEEIRAARLASGLTQTEAAMMVYVKLFAWQRWESAKTVKSHRTMPLASWELFLRKTEEKRNILGNRP